MTRRQEQELDRMWAAHPESVELHHSTSAALERRGLVQPALGRWGLSEAGVRMMKGGDLRKLEESQQRRLDADQRKLRDRVLAWLDAHERGGEERAFELRLAVRRVLPAVLLGEDPPVIARRKTQRWLIDEAGAALEILADYDTAAEEARRTGAGVTVDYEVGPADHGQAARERRHAREQAALDEKTIDLTAYRKRR